MVVVRLLMLGPTESGKTAIIEKITKKTFTTQYVATSEKTSYHMVDYKAKKVSLLLRELNYYLYTERLSSLSNSDGIIYVYNICSQDSFEEMIQMIKQVKNHSQAFAKLPFVIVGNRADGQGRKFDQNAVESLLLRLFPNVQYFETSAKCDDDLQKIILGLLPHLENLLNKDLQAAAETTALRYII